MRSGEGSEYLAENGVNLLLGGLEELVLGQPIDEEVPYREANPHYHRGQHMSVHPRT